MAAAGAILREAPPLEGGGEEGVDEGLILAINIEEDPREDTEERKEVAMGVRLREEDEREVAPGRVDWQGGDLEVYCDTRLRI